jgi:hypothetical protein
VKEGRKEGRKEVEGGRQEGRTEVEGMEVEGRKKERKEGSGRKEMEGRK